MNVDDIFDSIVSEAADIPEETLAENGEVITEDTVVTEGLLKNKDSTDKPRVSEHKFMKRAKYAKRYEKRVAALTSKMQKIAEKYKMTDKEDEQKKLEIEFKKLDAKLTALEDKSDKNSEELIDILRPYVKNSEHINTVLSHLATATVTAHEANTTKPELKRQKEIDAEKEKKESVKESTVSDYTKAVIEEAFYGKEKGEVVEESETNELNRLMISFMENCTTKQDFYEAVEEAYVFSEIDEPTFRAIITEMDEIDKENVVPQMLPQVPVDEPILKKEASGEESTEEGEEIEIGEMSEDILQFINDPDSQYSEYTEGAFGDFVDKIKMKFKLPAKVKRLISQRAALKAKLKIAQKKKAKPEKIASLKREVVAKEKEVRAVKPKDPKAKAAMDNLTREMDKRMAIHEKKYLRQLQKQGFFESETGVYDGVYTVEDVLSVENGEVMTEGIISASILSGLGSGIIFTVFIVAVHDALKIKKFKKIYAEVNKIPTLKDLKKSSFKIKPFSKDQEDKDHPIKGKNKFTQWLKESVNGNKVHVYEYNGKPFAKVAFRLETSSGVTSDGETVHTSRTEALVNLIHPIAKKHKEYYTVLLASNADNYTRDSAKFAIDWMKKHAKEEKAVKESVTYSDDLTDLLTMQKECKSLLEKAQDENDYDHIRIYTNKLKYVDAKMLHLQEAEDILIHPVIDGEIVSEAANIDPEIKDIIKILNEKGYKTKYSSAGHTKLRKKGDAKRDGVYHGKLYSDARIMFADTYNFTAAPKYWAWKMVDGNSYLDIIPLPYDKKDGSPSEAFTKWKSNYMGTLKTWADNLPTEDKTRGKVTAKDAKGREKVLESTNDLYHDMMSDILLEADILS